MRNSHPAIRTRCTLKALFGLLAGLVMVQNAFSQKITLKGIVMDTANGVLEGATVMLMEPKDSSLITFGRTQAGGLFELRNLTSQSYLLKISFLGLRSYSRLVLPTESDLGVIKLEEMPHNLNEVVIGAERNPIDILGDTIQYNAGSFKVQPNAVVEDLLKKLPGVQVEKDGSIKAQGQPVRRVTVDGKDFFGRDPKVATKNLPADAVDKVKVFDRMSDQSMFSGIDDGQREKTIDLKIKEDRKKMAFGNLIGGYGPDQRYLLKCSINKFNKDRQVSLLAMGNNVNQQGFSVEEYLNFSGAARQMMAGGGRVSLNLDDDAGIPLDFGGRINGFQTNWSGGLNYNDRLSKKTEIQSNYLYSRSGQKAERTINRQNFLNGLTYRNQENSTQKQTTENNRLNITLDHKQDSLNTFRWTNNLGLGTTDTRLESNAQNLIQGEGVQSESDRSTQNSGTNIRLNSELLWRHRFLKKGRNLSNVFNFGINNSSREGRLNANNYLFGSNGQPERTDTLKQTNTQDNKRTTMGMTLSYTEPIVKRHYLETNYSIQSARNEVNRQVFDIGEGEQTKTFNPALSNRFISHFWFQKLGSNYRYSSKNLNFSGGVAIQKSRLEGDLILKQVRIGRDFLNLLPNLRFSYNFTSSRSLNINYDSDIQAPDIQQLSPIIDNTDPLNIMEGNPNLKPEYQHRFNGQFNNFNALNFSSFFASVNLIYTTNQISMAQWVGDNLVRTFRPINLRDNYNLNTSISQGFRIKPLKSRYTLSTGGGFNRGLTLINDAENSTIRWESRNSFRWDFTPHDNFNLGAGATITYNHTAYSINHSQNQTFVNQNYEGELSWKVMPTVNFTSSLDYSIYNFAGSAFNQKIPIWSASVSKTFLKNNRGELKISTTDILNRNIYINRMAANNLVQDERIQTLGRYFLFSFTYKLGGLGGTGTPGMRVIVR